MVPQFDLEYNSEYLDASSEEDTRAKQGRELVPEDTLALRIASNHMS